MPVVDVLHLAVIVIALAVGVWSLLALRTSMPLGRFALFGLTSAGALFGCAALSGEVGLLPPVAWFAVVVIVLLGAALVARRAAQVKPSRG